MAELYRLGCLVDPTLAALTDDDNDDGRAHASRAAAAQPPPPPQQRTVPAVLPPDDTLSPDDAPTAEPPARVAGQRPRSAAPLSMGRAHSTAGLTLTQPALALTLTLE